MDPVTPAAPAQPAASAPAPSPAPTTAVEHAVSSGDFRAFRDAKRAEASGKPLAAPEATPAAAAEPKVSKRQQEINDHIRRATTAELEVARLQDENARLKTPAAPARTEPATPAAPAPPATTPDHERLLALPDAPKLETYDSVEKWTAAMSVFIADKRYEERQAADRQKQTETDSATAQRARGEAFAGRFKTATAADPTLLERLSPEVLALKPFSALAPGERGTALNAIAEEVLDSPIAPQLMLHFSEHPEELQRLAALPARALVREVGRLEARLDPSSEARPPAAPAQKTVPAAPAPPPTLGTRSTSAPADPVKAAIKSGDFRAFRAAKRQALTTRT